MVNECVFCCYFLLILDFFFHACFSNVTSKVSFHSCFSNFITYFFYIHAIFILSCFLLIQCCHSYFYLFHCQIFSMVFSFCIWLPILDFHFAFLHRFFYTLHILISSLFVILLDVSLITRSPLPYCCRRCCLSHGVSALLRHLTVKPARWTSPRIRSALVLVEALDLSLMMVMECLTLLLGRTLFSSMCPAKRAPLSQ